MTPEENQKHQTEKLLQTIKDQGEKINQLQKRIEELKELIKSEDFEKGIESTKLRAIRRSKSRQMKVETRETIL